MVKHEGIPLPVLFPEIVQHKDLAFQLEARFGSPTSAGFVDHKGEAYGQSVGLNLKSKPEDSIYIKKLLGYE